MAKQNHGQNVNNIDEQYLMSMMAGKEKPLQESPAESNGEIKPTMSKKVIKARDITETFEAIFLKNANTTARTGKSVYIRPEFHERLSRIVQVIGEDKITIYAYLDNLLEYHFKEFGEQITQSFNDKYKPIL
jgi:hypothetical protein